jgi:uncharacterized protein YcfL
MNINKTQTFIIVIVLFVTGCSSEKTCIESDLVLVNTKIYTANPKNPTAEALAIKNGKFSFYWNKYRSSEF